MKVYELYIFSFSEYKVELESMSNHEKTGIAQYLKEVPAAPRHQFRIDKCQRKFTAMVGRLVLIVYAHFLFSYR